MKNLFLFVFIASFFTANAQTQLLADFENENSLVLTNYNSELQSERVINPAPDNVNSSSYVAKLTMISDPTQIGGVPQIDGFYNAEDNNVLTLKLWTSVEVDVAIKLENAAQYGEHNSIAKTTVTTLNEWVNVTITFDTDDVKLNKFGLFFDGQNNATGNVYYVDDLTTPNLYTTNQLAFIPSDGSTNASRSGNLTIYTNKGLVKADASALTSDDLSNLITLKEEDSTGDDVPFSATINGSKDTITIDPTNPLTFSTAYYLSIDETGIAYNDDSAVLAESTTFTVQDLVANQTLVDFETPETDASWSSWGGTGFAKIDNPDKTGINVSDKVGKYTVPNGDSGIENEDVNGAKLPFFDYGVTPYFRVKVWVSKPVTVGMQLQNNPDWGNNPSGIKNILVEETEQWVELVYNFSALTADNHNRIQLYFDRDKSRGSVAGDVYYFDDVHKGDVPPSGASALLPVDGATEVALTSTLSITGSLAFKNTDDTEITDANNNVELREGDANGTLVPINVGLSTDGLALHIIPDELLTPNTTYWYGIKENTTKYSGLETITGVSATFTSVDTNTPTFTIYEDHNGDEDLTSLVEGLGENGSTATITEIVDPDSPSNFILQYDKSPDSGGWSSVHYVLDRAIDFSSGDVFSVKIKSATPSWVRFKLSSDVQDWVGTWDETDANIFLTNEFQTLYFDFKELIADEPDKDRSNYTHIKIFINGGDNTAASFYLDDVKGPGLGPDLNVDSDSDGINDGEDDCPNTPEGETVDNNGCSETQSNDSDKDGVPNRFDQCDTTPEGAVVDANGCEIFSLPNDNFEVAVTSNSCLGSNDGSVQVSAKDETLQYQVEINEAQYELNATSGFEKIVESLDVGTYDVCFSVVDQEDFQQCFTVVLSQPDPLSVLAALSNSGEQVALTLSGADSYQLEHNGITKTISEDNLNVPLFKGPNSIRVTTGLDCQGIFEENYFNSENILAYPTATKNEVKVVVGGIDEKAQFIVRDLRGLTLMRMTKNLTRSRTSTVNLDGYAKGVYFIEVNSPTVRQTTKILKND
jgi:hypothetical protein